MRRSAILYVVSILFGLGPHINFIFNGGGEFYSNSTVYLRKKLHVFNSIVYYYDGDVHIQNHGVKEDDSIMWSRHYYHEINFLIFL